MKTFANVLKHEQFMLMIETAILTAEYIQEPLWAERGEQSRFRRSCLRRILEECDREDI